MRILPELVGQENPAEDKESRVLRIANRAPGTAQDIDVKVVAGPTGGPAIVAAVAGDRRVTVDPPSINGDGDVLITFSDAGGANSGFPP